MCPWGANHKRAVLLNFCQSGRVDWLRVLLQLRLDPQKIKLGGLCGFELLGQSSFHCYDARVLLALLLLLLFFWFSFPGFLGLFFGLFFGLSCSFFGFGRRFCLGDLCGVCGARAGRRGCALRLCVDLPCQVSGSPPAPGRELGSPPPGL